MKAKLSTGDNIITQFYRNTMKDSADVCLYENLAGGRSMRRRCCTLRARGRCGRRWARHHGGKGRAWQATTIFTLAKIDKGRIWTLTGKAESQKQLVATERIDSYGVYLSSSLGSSCLASVYSPEDSPQVGVIQCYVGRQQDFTRKPRCSSFCKSCVFRSS